MKDKNGTDITLGMSVIDIHGNVGTLVDVNGAEAIYFIIKDKPRYVFSSRIIENQIEIVENKSEI
jgi:hypothetical protein